MRHFIILAAAAICLAAASYPQSPEPEDMTAEEVGKAIVEATAAWDNELYERLISLALEKFPHHPAVAEYTFNETFYGGDFERALEIASEAGKLDPENAGWAVKRGVVLYELDRFTESESAFLEALEKGDETPFVYMYLGNIEMQKGAPDFGDARGYYEKGLSYAPPGSDAPGLVYVYYDLAVICAATGDLPAGLDYLDRALSLNPGYADKAAADPQLEALRGDPRFTESVAAAAAAYADGVTAYATVLPGVKAPDFALPDTDDNVVRLSDYAGSLVVLNVWATWCPPCRAEITDIAELYSEYRDEGLVVLSISVDEITEEFTVDQLKEVSAQFGVNYPVLLSTEEVIEAYISKAGGIPETYFIGPDGTVLDFIYGMADREVLESKIKKYLYE